MQMLPNNIFGILFILMGAGMGYAALSLKKSSGERFFNLCQGVKADDKAMKMAKNEAVKLVTRFEAEAAVMFVLTGVIVQFMGKPIYFSVVCFACLGWLNYKKGLTEHRLKGGEINGKKQ